MKEKRVIAKVIEVRGKGCDLGIKLGDEFEMDIRHSDFCGWAYNALFPYAFAMKFGGSFPWEPEDSNTTLVACPDPYNTVVFELTALDE